MTFVKLGNWSVRADRIEAVNIHATACKVTIHTIDNKEYPFFFNTERGTYEAHQQLMAELNQIGD